MPSPSHPAPRGHTAAAPAPNRWDAELAADGSTPTAACTCSGAARLLVLPGLRNSGAAHWQTWLERQHRDALRVVQDDWETPDLAAWLAGIDRALAGGGGGPWVAVAHSFGVLALAQHLAARPQSPIRTALLVAPADPHKFGLAEHLPKSALPRPTTLVASSSDPWMSLASAQDWAARWGSALVNLGQAGHVNTEAGFGPFPFARQWVLAAQQRQVSARRQVGQPPPARRHAAPQPSTAHLQPTA